jgi:hypothetical protein
MSSKMDVAFLSSRTCTTVPVEDQPDDRPIGERTAIPVPIALHLAPALRWPFRQAMPVAEPLASSTRLALSPKLAEGAHGAAKEGRPRPGGPARVGPPAK